MLLYQESIVLVRSHGQVQKLNLNAADLHLTTTGEPASGLRCAGNIDILRLRLGLKHGVGDLMITLVVA